MDLKLIITTLILVSQVVTLQNNTYEVIIIGAGIAGLRASQILARDKIPHLIL
jgi:ribulose 1,5-bisphosphate synthetase/thiazole synthase